MFDFEFLPITLLYYHPFGIRANSVTPFFYNNTIPTGLEIGILNILSFWQNNLLVHLVHNLFSNNEIFSLLYPSVLCVPCSMFHRGFSECGLCPLFSILLHFCKLIFHNFRLLPCNDSNSLLNDVYEKTFG